MPGPQLQPYFIGDDLPAPGFTWKQDGELIDFTDGGWSFVCRLGTRSQPALVEVTTVAGGPYGPDTAPNIVVTFADGDLDPLPVGLADGLVIATRAGLSQSMPFELPVHRTIPAPTP